MGDSAAVSLQVPSGVELKSNSPSKRGRRHSQPLANLDVKVDQKILGHAKQASMSNILDHDDDDADNVPSTISRVGFAIPNIVISKTTRQGSDLGPKSAPLETATSPTVLGKKLSMRSLSLRKRNSAGLEPVNEQPSLLRTPVSSKTPQSGKHSPLLGATKVVGRRLSSLLRKEREEEIAESKVSPLVPKLDETLLERDNRNVLVSQLLAAHHRDASLSVRFISGINELVRTGGSRDNRAKAKKLVSLFLDTNSSYYLKDLQIPKDLANAVTQGNLDALVPLKVFFLEELLKLDIVKTFLEDFPEPDDS
jgi:hypothetical protein